MSVKKYLIGVNTNWCGMDTSYAAICEEDKIDFLESLATNLAYDNFYAYGCDQLLLDEICEDSDNPTDEELEELYSIESDKYGYNIEEFEGSNEEFNEYELIFTCLE